MDETIKLDQKTIKALGAEMRVKILKKLTEKRMTQSELASVLGISVPSAKEHLDNLFDAGLVEKDESRKWKYYALTRKGKQMVQPSEVKVWLLLSFSVLLLLGSTYTLLGKLSSVPSKTVATGSFNTGKDTASPLMLASSEQSSLLSQIGILEIVLFVVSLVTIGAVVGYIVGRKSSGN